MPDSNIGGVTNSHNQTAVPTTAAVFAGRHPITEHDNSAKNLQAIEGEKVIGKA